MHLIPKEIDSLLVNQVGSLAQKRLARCLRLNHVEATALIASQILELIRDGLSLMNVRQKGKEMLGFRQVLPGVANILTEIQVEGTFVDGTKLVTVHDPICRLHGDLQLALYGSFLPTPDVRLFEYPNSSSAADLSKSNEEDEAVTVSIRREGGGGDTHHNDNFRQQQECYSRDPSERNDEGENAILTSPTLTPISTYTIECDTSTTITAISHERLSSSWNCDRMGGKRGGLRRRISPLEEDEDIIPGEIFIYGDREGEDEEKLYIHLNVNRRRVELTVTSFCDRAIQVGSHYNFFEVNKRLQFDRAKAFGMRLDIPAGQSLRFEPGQSRSVRLVEISGRRIVAGGNFLTDGKTTVDRLPEVMKQMEAKGFLNKEEKIINNFTKTTANRGRDSDYYIEDDQNGEDAAAVAAVDVSSSSSFDCSLIPRHLYSHTYGPTTGDCVRLGDTSLIIRVEKDFAVYGDECKFGGGKVLREGMGQMAGCPYSLALDVVITNALIVDAIGGIIKADIGVKEGFIVGIGKAGNPDTMENVDSNLIVGAATEVIAGEGLILTAGGIDTHVHFICPQLCEEALASGLTTLIGGGTGPATGSCATTCTPGKTHIRNMIEATDVFPINCGFTGKGNSSLSCGFALDLEEQVVAGAIGLKLHEDWGCTPAAIDTCLRVAEAHDVQVTIHTDTLNESGCVEETLEAFKERTIHTYHSEGAGGGHAPDILVVCSKPNVLPSSTNPTRPFTVNTIEEHFDMLMVCHHLDANLKEDLAFAESRIRAETIGAEDILHDMGCISIISSDSQAMGRIGEVICRTWQTADKMKRQRGHLDASSSSSTQEKEAGELQSSYLRVSSDEVVKDDNFRVKRYIAKYTINPALSHGIGHIVGSVEVGKWADLVLWSPAFFGVKPHMIIKGGIIAQAQMGLSNGSIPTTQPIFSKPMFAAFGKSVGSSSIVFVSKMCKEKNVTKNWGLMKSVIAVKNCRTVKKKNMMFNDVCLDLKVDPETYCVSVKKKNREKREIIKEEEKEDEEVLECEPASVVPLAQRYYLF